MATTTNGLRQSPESPPPAEPEVLRRGLAAFAELGYPAASTAQLAGRVGLAERELLERYQDKAAFWQATVDFALAEHAEYLGDALDAELDLDDEDRLRAVITRLYRLAAANPQLNRLIADEACRDSERLDYLYQHFLRPTLDAVKPSVHRLVESGRLPPIPSYLLYFVITGPAAALSQHAMASRLGRPTVSTVEDEAAVVDTLTGLVVKSLLAN